VKAACVMPNGKLGSGVFVVENTGAPEQDKTLFHDNAFLGHES
jgi:hypothetical protein